jgi:hypothetical protein
MAIYGRSSWARINLGTDLEAELAKFKDFNNWLGVSAIAGRIQLADPLTEVTLGINPINKARLDMGLSLEGHNPTDLLNAFLERGEDTSVTVGTEELDFAPVFGGVDDLFLDEDWAAFWIVKQKRVDVEHSESQREHLAAKMFNRPFRILETEDKNEIKDLLESEIIAERKQNLVFINFKTGRIYTDMTDDKSLQYFYFFMKENFEIELNATTMYFGPNETPWQYDFFKTILADNIISGEMDELIESYLDETKLAALREKYEIVDYLYKKKKTYCQYSDESYLVSLNTPALICDEKVKSSIGSQDNISCWEVLSQIENWNVLGSDLVIGRDNGVNIIKANVNVCNALTWVFKNVEMTKTFLEDHSDDCHSYNEYALAYIKCLSLFEDIYVALIKRVLQIENDDVTTGIKVVMMSVEESVEA